MEPDAPHARTSCINSANGRELVWDNFGKAGGPVVKVVGKPFHVSKELPDGIVDSDAVVGGNLKAMLEGTEETFATRNGKDHGTEFPKDFAPSFDGGA